MAKYTFGFKCTFKNRLRGSTSTVLTAMALLMGDSNFRPPPHRIHTSLDWSPKNLLQVITSAATMAVPNLMQIRPWGLLGKWVKYNKNLFTNTFWGTHLQVRLIDRFSRLMAQTTRTRGKVCLLGVLLILLPILGMKSPQKTQLRGVNTRFQAKWANIESFILLKLLHRFQPNCAKR